MCSFCHTLTLLGLCVWLDIIVALLMIRLSRIFYPTTRKNSTATLLGPKNRILCSSVSLVMDLFDGGSKKKQDFWQKWTHSKELIVLEIHRYIIQWMRVLQKLEMIAIIKLFQKLKLIINVSKVRIFWEDHKILRNLHRQK